MLRELNFQAALVRFGFAATLSISGGSLRACNREARTPGLGLANGRAAALRKIRTPKCLPKVDPWHIRRIQQIDRAEVGPRIGHLDLRGLPR